MDRINGPLVSVGIPVRNGAPLLDVALEQIINQTYKNLEIIISDNNSTDETSAICEKYARMDPRIRYIRQNETLKAIENFKYVAQLATADYFMWAAHDDRRTSNYIEVLLQTAVNNPNFSIIFTDASDFSEYHPFNPVKLNYNFASNRHTPILKKLKCCVTRGVHFYGLHRRSIFKDWYWYDSDFGWDTILLAYESVTGDVIKADGAMFYCFRPANRSAKSPVQRARDNSLSEIRPFYMARWCWHITRAAGYAAKKSGLKLNTFILFLRLYLPYVWWPHFKIRAFKIAPPFAQNMWKRFKRVSRHPAL